MVRWSRTYRRAETDRSTTRSRYPAFGTRLSYGRRVAPTAPIDGYSLGKLCNCSERDRLVGIAAENLARVLRRSGQPAARSAVVSRWSGIADSGAS